MIVAVGAVAGGIDKLFGSRWGLGEKFEEGLKAAATLIVPVAGMVVVTPIIAKLLSPIIIPVFKIFGADPAMFAALISSDMGGYSLAMSLAKDPQAGMMAGLITGTLLGGCIVFSIPVGLGIIEDEDKPYFAKGLLLGLITVPVGSIAGGMLAGFNPRMVLTNHIVIIIFALFLGLGLKFYPNRMIKGTIVFGKAVTGIAIAGMMAGIVRELTGVVILKEAGSLMDGLKIVCDIVIVLVGIFPVLALMLRFLKGIFQRAGALMGINDISAAGLLFSLATPIPVFHAYRDMDKRGKIVNVAWMVTAQGMLGDYLGFTAGVNPAMIKPMIMGKMCGCLLAAVIAIFVIQKETEKENKKMLTFV